MGSNVTIYLPAFNWPAVVLILGLIFLWRSGWLVKRSPGTKRATKPKSKPRASRQKRPKTQTFHSSKNGRTVHVSVDDHKPNSISDIR